MAYLLRQQVRLPSGNYVSFGVYLPVQWLGWGTIFGCLGAAFWLPWGGIVGFGGYSAYVVGMLVREARRAGWW